MPRRKLPRPGSSVFEYARRATTNLETLRSRATEILVNLRILVSVEVGGFRSEEVVGVVGNNGYAEQKYENELHRPSIALGRTDEPNLAKLPRSHAEAPVQKEELLSLLAELKAIELWDQFYLLAEAHDAVDRCAWEHRREREAAIYIQLLFPKSPFPPVSAGTGID